MTKTKILNIARTIDAPRELVWKAWTQPEYIARWWGPRNFTAPVVKMDFREGGTYLYCMRSPEGRDFWSTGAYREIVDQKRIVATDSFADPEGHLVPASYYGMSDDFLPELLLTVTLADAGGKTKLTLKHAGFPPGKAFDDAKTGWNESLDKFSETVKMLREERLLEQTELVAAPGKQEVVIRRVFNAPLDRVFQTFTDPNLIPQWWGPKNLTTTVDRMEVKPGGMWRFVERGQGGDEYAFHGVFHNVSPDRLVYTFEYEGMPGHVLMETVTLEEHNGKTQVTDQSVYQTVNDRDGMLKSGMEWGGIEAMDRLKELLVNE